MKLTKLLSYTVMIALAITANTASAQTRIEVTFESNSAVTGTAFAPLAGVFHDGSFSSFTPGTAASPGLEALAEGGNPSQFLAEAAAIAPTANVGNTSGQIGGTNRPNGLQFEVDVDDSNTQFSYASMFLPSNDWFIANPGGATFDVSSLIGAAPGTELSIDVLTIYDAGTELEDFTRGGGTGTDPFDLVPRLTDANGGNPDDQDDNISVVNRTAGVNLFQNFVNPNNEPIDRFLGASSSQLGTIRLRVVPIVQTRIEVIFESNSAVTGTAFAPLAGVFHDGSFASFTPGTAASPGLEALAEGGNPSQFLAEAAAIAPTANVGNTSGQIGGTNRPNGLQFEVDVDDSNTQFSYASMFLPSNDWFIANPGGATFDVSSLIGAAPGTELSIDVLTIYDAGTELEDFTRGGGTGTDPFDLVPRLTDANGGNPDDQDDNISVVNRTAGVNLFQNFVNPNNEPIDRFLGASSSQLGTIRLRVVSTALLGDVNLDGVVDYLDISPFILFLSTNGLQEEADINQDGFVNFLDISPFIVLLSSP